MAGEHARRLASRLSHSTISTDGQNAVWTKAIGYNTKLGVHWFQAESATNVYFPSRSSGRAAIAANGQRIAYESSTKSPISMMTNTDVLVYNTIQSNSCLVSMNLARTSPGNSNSFQPVLSSDGRFVAFSSEATDLAPGDADSLADLYGVDLESGITLLLTRTLAGRNAGALPCRRMFFGPDGRSLVVPSAMPGMVAGDYNDTEDVFVIRFNIGDADHDGLPDLWEHAHFNGLGQGATDDPDADGQSNAMEFHAGTNPVQNTSLLTLAVPSVAANGQVRLSWRAVPGRFYSVEYQDRLGDTVWQQAPVSVTLTGALARAIDSVPSPVNQRFYRVVAQP